MRGVPFGGRTCSYLRTVTRAPLDHANLLFNYGLPSRHVTYTSHARTFLVVDMNEHTHPLVVSPLLEMPSAEDTAIDGSLAHHLDAPPSGTGHCGKRGPFWATLPVTPWGDTYILFFNDRFSRREDMVAVTAAEFVGPTSLSTDTPPFERFSLVSLSIHPRSRRGAKPIRQGEGRCSRPPEMALERSDFTEKFRFRASHTEAET